MSKEEGKVTNTSQPTNQEPTDKSSVPTGSKQIITHSITLNNLQELDRFTVPDNQQQALHAYYLLKKPQNGFYGLMCIARCAEDIEACEKWLNEKIGPTCKLNLVWRINPTGKFFVLTDNTDPSKLSFLHDKGRKLLRDEHFKEEERIKKEAMQLEDRRKQSEKIEMQLLDETSLLYYTKLRAQLELNVKLAKERQRTLEDLMRTIADSHKTLVAMDKKYPEYSQKWVEALKQLGGQKELLERLKQTPEELRKQIKEEETKIQELHTKLKTLQSEEKKLDELTKQLAPKKEEKPKEEKVTKPQ